MATHIPRYLVHDIMTKQSENICKHPNPVQCSYGAYNCPDCFQYLSNYTPPPMTERERIEEIVKWTSADFEKSKKGESVAQWMKRVNDEVDKRVVDELMIFLESSKAEAVRGILDMYIGDSENFFKLVEERDNQQLSKPLEGEK